MYFNVLRSDSVRGHIVLPPVKSTVIFSSQCLQSTARQAGNTPNELNNIDVSHAIPVSSPQTIQNTTRHHLVFLHVARLIAALEVSKPKYSQAAGCELISYVSVISHADQLDTHAILVLVNLHLTCEDAVTDSYSMT